MPKEKSIPEWDELSPEEQLHAQQYLQELDQFFTDYTEREDSCEDFTLDD